MFSLLKMVCLLRKGNMASRNSELVHHSLGNPRKGGDSGPKSIREIKRKVTIWVSLDHITNYGGKKNGQLGRLVLKQKHKDGNGGRAGPTKKREGLLTEGRSKGSEEPQMDPQVTVAAGFICLHPTSILNV